MAKAVSSKKPVKTNSSKTSASYASKKTLANASAKDNPSKYAPGKDTDPGKTTLNADDGLVKFFAGSLRVIYWAENQLVKTLPKMAGAAASSQLSTAILDHLQQTNIHVERLEQVFGLLGKKVQAKKCDAIEGLTKEGEGLIEETEMGTLSRDLGIIGVSQKVEHYEMTAYQSLIAIARYLDLNEIADTLSLTYSEENDSDQLLTAIANDLLS